MVFACVSHTYDAWGNILSITGGLASTVGQINPFRYRGYYYDSETDLYYLNSRYYDAEVGRFINADGIVGANGGLQGYNMFSYCNNSPVMFYDPSGCMGEIIEENFDNNDPFDLFPEGMDGGCGSGYYFSFSNATYSSLYSGGIYNGNGSFGYTTPGVYSSYSAYKNTTAYNEAFYNSPYNINVTPSYSTSSSANSSKQKLDLSYNENQIILSDMGKGYEKAGGIPASDVQAYYDLCAEYNFHVALMDLILEGNIGTFHTFILGTAVPILPLYTN